VGIGHTHDSKPLLRFPRYDDKSDQNNELPVGFETIADDDGASHHTGRAQNQDGDDEQ
jgi:hypothetical protein